jgi:hypothetical protein
MGMFDHIPENAPSVPVSDSQSMFAHIPGEGDPAKPQASETERKLTAENLRRLEAARGGGNRTRTLMDLVAGREPVRGSYLERATDEVIPGIKNVMGGVLSLGTGGGGTWGEKWRAGVNAEKQFREKNQERTAGPLGWAATGAGIVGSMGRPGSPFAGAPPSGPVAQGAPVVQATERSAMSVPKATGIAATQGGISGAAQQAQDPESALVGGGTGAVIGGGTSLVLQGLLGRFAQNKAAAAERQATRGPTPEAYREEAGTLFKQLDNAGIAFDRGQAMRLAGALPRTLRTAAYDAGRNPEFAEIIRDLGNVGVQGAQPLTFGRLQALRDRIGTFATTNDPNMRRIAGHLTGLVDNFVENQVPAVNRAGINLADIYPRARQLWRTSLLGDSLTHVEDVAARTAASNPRSTLTPEDRTRSAVTRTLNDVTDRRNYNPFSKAQIAAGEQVSRGTRTQNLLEGANQLSKDWKANAAIGAGAGTTLGAVTGLPIGITGPVAAALGGAGGKAIGGSAKSAADRIAQDNMDAFVRSVMTGSADMPASWSMPRDLLATLMANRVAARGVGQTLPNAIMNKETPPP